MVVVGRELNPNREGDPAVIDAVTEHAMTSGVAGVTSMPSVTDGAITSCVEYTPIATVAD